VKNLQRRSKKSLRMGFILERNGKRRMYWKSSRRRNNSRRNTRSKRKKRSKLKKLKWLGKYQRVRIIR